MTMTCTRSGAASVSASVAPAAALSAAVTCAVATRTVVCSKRIAVTTAPSSKTSAP